MSCGCIANHWEILVLVLIGIAIPTLYIFRYFVSIQRDKIRRAKLLRKQMSEFYGANNPEQQYGETVYLNRDGID